MPKQKLYVFWRDSSFPYYLGSGVDRWADSGLIKVTGYGGAMFKPVVVLPMPIGLLVQEQLDDLESERDFELDLLESKFREKLSKIMEKYGDLP